MQTDIDEHPPPSKVKSFIFNLEDHFITKRLAPNFLVAHYVYMLTLIIISSVLLLIGNGSKIAYVDLLFFACSASTQAGLSTVVSTDLTLFQQIVLYFLCMLTTPLFIHGSLVFIRLFWYEKRFKNIQQTSVEQFKLKKTNTLAQLRAGMSRSNTGFTTTTSFNQFYDPHNASKDLVHRIKELSKHEDISPVLHKQDIKFGDLPKPANKNISLENEYFSERLASNSDISDNEMEEDFEIMKSVKANTDRTHGKFNIHKRKITLKNKKNLNKSFTLKNNTHDPSNLLDSPSVVNSEQSTEIEIHDLKSYNPEKIIDNNLSFEEIQLVPPTLKKSHTIQTISTSIKNVNQYLPRSLTAVTDINKPLDELNDDEIISIAAKQKEIYPVWGVEGRNSNVIPLTKEQKQELGGVEYQAMKVLSRIVYGYYFSVLIFIPILFLIPFIKVKKDSAFILETDGCSRPIWWAFFTALSGFANEGLTVNGSSFVIFDKNVYLLVVFSFVMLGGNTALPVVLRCITYIIKCFTKPSSITYESLTFLLDHPRRCFTLMFPTKATLWLLAVVACLNGIDWILYIILDYGRSTLSYLPKGYRILDGLFQSICTRTTGFNVISLTDLNHAIQLSYVVMMYISALPLAISIRSTNVYEDQSLGIYNAEVTLDEDDDGKSTTKHKVEYIAGHLRKQLSHDLWFVSVAIFLICIIEQKRLDADDLNFDTFRIMFEVVSAYGTVGLSLGYPNFAASFCGEFHVLSKLIIMLVMIRGRHRGLPDAIDRSIILPGEKLERIDTVENNIDLQRMTTTLTSRSERSL